MGHVITPAMVARARGLAEPRLSPDGRQVAFVSMRGGRAELVIVPAGGGAELVVTADPPVAGVHPAGGGAFDWCPDGESLVYVTRGRGLQLVSVHGGAPRTIVADGSDVDEPHVSPDGTRVAYTVDERHVAVASLERHGPWPIRVSSGTNDFAIDPAWSPDGRLLAWHEWNVPAMPWDESRIVVAPADASAPPRVVAGGPGVQVQQPLFSPDGSWLAFLSDENGWLNVWLAGPDGRDPQILVEERFEHGGPTWGPGQRTLAWSPDSGAVAFCRNERGFGRLCIAEVDTGGVQELGRGVHYGLSWAGDRVAAVRTGGRTPTQIASYLLPGGEREVLARGPVAGFEAAGLPEPEVVALPGDDGDVVHGRLYRPARSHAVSDPPPLLVWVHGGPTGQNQVVFAPKWAYFLERGWAILDIDHRGSTGWGRAYTQALRGRWGELDVADVAAGIRAAVEQGWADPKRIVPIGGSAGGLTVLLLLVRHGELCAAGVDMYGVTDLFDLDESTHRFEAHYNASLIGSLPAAAPLYRERSPLTHAERIAGPLLVLHGGDDKVVSVRQSDALVERLRAEGETVEYHVYEGEGHGFSKPEAAEDSLRRIESFLTRHVLKWLP